MVDATQTSSQQDPAATDPSNTAAADQTAATQGTNTDTSAPAQGDQNGGSQANADQNAAQNDARGNQAGDAGSAATGTAGTDVPGGTTTAPQAGADTGTQATQSPVASAQTPATPVAAPSQASGQVTQQAKRSVTIPQNVQAGVKTQAATAPVVKNTTQSAGTVVQKNGQMSTSDLNLPEVLAAMKVAKPQTMSALVAVVTYATNMHPTKRQDQKTIEQNQIQLATALYTICSAEDANFSVVYKGLLAIVKNHLSNCFKVTMRNRGLNTVALGTIDNKQMRFFTRFLDLLTLTAGTNNVEQIKQHFDFEKFFSSCPNVQIQKNLTAYYSAM